MVKEGVKNYREVKRKFGGEIVSPTCRSAEDQRRFYPSIVEKANVFLEAAKLLEEEGNYKMAAVAYKDSTYYISEAASRSPYYDTKHHWENELKKVEKKIPLMNEKRGIKVGSYLDRRKNRSLEAITAIIGLVGGAFFLSSNMTGNVIGLSASSSNIIGSVLLIIGLVACFFWVKSKKKSSIKKVVKKRKK
jgi:hypothetical protein